MFSLGFLDLSPKAHDSFLLIFLSDLIKGCQSFLVYLKIELGLCCDELEVSRHAIIDRFVGSVLLIHLSLMNVCQNFSVLFLLQEHLYLAILALELQSVALFLLFLCIRDQIVEDE